VGRASPLRVSPGFPVLSSSDLFYAYFRDTAFAVVQIFSFSARNSLYLNWLGIYLSQNASREPMATLVLHKQPSAGEPLC